MEKKINAIKSCFDLVLAIIPAEKQRKVKKLLKKFLDELVEVLNENN